MLLRLLSSEQLVIEDFSPRVSISPSVDGVCSSCGRNGEPYGALPGTFGLFGPQIGGGEPESRGWRYSRGCMQSADREEECEQEPPQSTREQRPGVTSEMEPLLKERPSSKIQYAWRLLIGIIKRKGIGLLAACCGGIRHHLSRAELDKWLRSVRGPVSPAVSS